MQNNHLVVSATPKFSNYSLNPTWEGVVLADFEEIFTTSGMCKPCCLVIPDLNIFKCDLYIGQSVINDQILGKVYASAKAMGYDTKDHHNKGDGKLKKGFLVLSLDGEIRGGGKQAQAFWVRKYTASAQWIEVPIEFSTDAETPREPNLELVTS